MYDIAQLPFEFNSHQDALNFTREIGGTPGLSALVIDDITYVTDESGDTDIEELRRLARRHRGVLNQYERPIEADESRRSRGAAISFTDQSGLLTFNAKDTAIAERVVSAIQKEYGKRLNKVSNIGRKVVVSYDDSDRTISQDIKDFINKRSNKAGDRAIKILKDPEALAAWIKSQPQLLSQLNQAKKAEQDPKKQSLLMNKYVVAALIAAGFGVTTLGTAAVAYVIVKSLIFLGMLPFRVLNKVLSWVRASHRRTVRQASRQASCRRRSRRANAYEQQYTNPPSLTAIKAKPWEQVQPPKPITPDPFDPEQRRSNVAAALDSQGQQIEIDDYVYIDAHSLAQVLDIDEDNDEFIVRPQNDAYTYAVGFDRVIKASNTKPRVLPQAREIIGHG